MSNFLHILLISIGILAATVILKSSGAAIYRKNVNYKSLDEQVREEIENSFHTTMSQLSRFEMDVPAKITIKPMKNEEGNMFNEPFLVFLVGNSHEIRVYHYMPPAIDNWCSGVISKHTQLLFEHKNRRISVVFDCNRKMVFPSLRTIVGWCLVAFSVNAVIIAVRIFAPKFESVINRVRNRSSCQSENEKPISSDDYIVDDQDESVLMYLEGAARIVENSNMIDSFSPKDLSDMPNDVVELIIQRSDYKEQLLLRKTSKSLRELVDKQTPALKTLSIHCGSDYIKCFYNDQHFVYASPRSQDIGYWRKKGYTPIVRADYEDVAFDDLAFILKNPKLQLEVFEFDSFYYGRYERQSFDIENGRNWEVSNKIRKVQNILKSIKHQLSVKTCNIDVTCLFTAKSFFLYLKPGVLEKIILCEINGYFICSETMTEVALLDQWKQAKELQIKCVYRWGFPKGLTLFKRFQRAYRNIKYGIRHFIRIFILEHENVEFCSISDVHEKHFDATYIDTIGLTHVSPNLYHYTIPDSDHYLEFKITDKEITIEKKMKQ